MAIKDTLKHILNFDQIVEADDLKSERVFIEEWGGSVIIKALSAAERDAWEKERTTGKGKNRAMNMNNLRAGFVALCMVGEDGKRIFGDSQIAQLGRKSAAAIEKLFDKARELSGMSEADVEEMETNLESEASEDSSLT